MVTPLRDILRRTVRAWGLEPVLFLLEAQAAWPEIVGPALAEVSAPLSIRQGVMRVGVLAAVAAQELRLRQAEIAADVNRRVGDRTVTKIVTVPRRRLPPRRR